MGNSDIGIGSPGVPARSVPTRGEVSRRAAKCPDARRVPTRGGVPARSVPTRGEVSRRAAKCPDARRCPGAECPDARRSVPTRGEVSRCAACPDARRCPGAECPERRSVPMRGVSRRAAVSRREVSRCAPSPGCSEGCPGGVVLFGDLVDFSKLYFVPMSSGVPTGCGGVPGAVQGVPMVPFGDLVNFFATFFCPDWLWGSPDSPVRGLGRFLSR